MGEADTLLDMLRVEHGTCIVSLVMQRMTLIMVSRALHTGLLYTGLAKEQAQLYS